MDSLHTPKAPIRPFAPHQAENSRFFEVSSCGSKLPCRSRGTAISILLVSVATVLRP